MKYLVLLTALLCLHSSASAFCGFYVAKADAKLFNKSSQVIIARDGNHTVITMSNDFQGSVSDFAMVVPVPEILQESDIRVVQQHIFDKFDAYTAPRMVEYWDQNPCTPPPLKIEMLGLADAVTSSKDMPARYDAEEDKDLGVTVEATYTVGEYDILILSAKESGGLKAWLTGNGYKIPADAEEVLQPYINDGMKFFVVKVNLDEQAKAGYSALRPLQIQFNSEKFMLPIRLGMANASSAQDLVVYAFTRNGRVETANYRTTKLPTDREIPTFVKEKDLFGEFYVSTFDKAWKQEGRNSVMLEYAWNVSGSNPVKCDPCNTPLVTFAELREAGVWWLEANQWSGGYTGPLFITRLHVRYSRDKFPQDLAFINTPNQENFQGRYIVRHPATGDLSCDAGKKYQKELDMRRRKELQELVALTGWSESRYQWYLGDAGKQVQPITDPREQDPNTELFGQADKGSADKTPAPVAGMAAVVNSNGEVFGDVTAEEPGASTVPEGLTPTDEFIARAKVQAAEAAAPANNTWLLLLAAAGMFAIGILVRVRKKIT